MELILWRHAEAEDGSKDLARALTDKGQTQAKMMVKWLKPRLPKNHQLWVSEAVRSQQTAAVLSDQYTVYPQLNPDVPHEAVMRLLYETHWQKNLVIVGHQPWIGRVCAGLMGCRHAPSMDWSVKKGALWWFEIKGGEAALTVKIKAVMHPTLLIRPAH